MDEIVFITTFSQEHIRLYGERFVSTFNKYNNHLKLYVYAENFKEHDLPGNFVFLDFEQTIPQHRNFLNHINYKKINLDPKSINRLSKALRWSYKSFAIIHALENIKCKYLVWIDADVETIGYLDQTNIDKIARGKLITVYPQNLKGELHIESGLVIFNQMHPSIVKIIDHYKKGYHEEEILKLNKPWDGFWLGKYCKNYENEINFIRPPFGNMRRIFKHHVGKEKFKNIGYNKFSGRKD